MLFYKEEQVNARTKRSYLLLTYLLKTLFKKGPQLLDKKEPTNQDLYIFFFFSQKLQV